TFSPAATSWSAVTLGPSAKVWGTSDCTWGILLAISVYSASVPRTTRRMRRLVPHTAALFLFAGDERRLFGEPAEPEDEGDEREEDEHAGADHLRGVAERRRGGVLARVLQDLPDVPVLADAAAGESHQPHQPGERDREHEQRILRARRHLAPADRAQRLRPAAHHDVDRRHEHDARQHRANLLDAVPEAHDRFAEAAPA